MIHHYSQNKLCYKPRSIFNAPKNQAKKYKMRDFINQPLSVSEDKGDIAKV
jgi:hypothetical protein